MSKSLENALGEGAWSVSSVIYDLNDMIDDEGRPVSERRADAAVRVGVEMEMRLCPFGGIRENKWMNVSALEQISRYYTAALAEMAAFRHQIAGADVTWADILAGVIDLLAGPAMYLLQQRNPQGPVPAQIAVGHKLAAGFFGVVRGMHERIALGAELPVTVDNFLNLVDEMEALVGASEACAGSPPMLRKAVTALLEGHTDNHVELDHLRLETARRLALQVQLGIFWHLYDSVHLWSLVKGELREHLTPFNSFLKRKIEHVEEKQDTDKPQQPNSSMLPDALEAQLRQKLADALNDTADPQALEEDLSTATGLLNDPGSAISYSGDTESLALHVAGYLNTYRLFVDELSRLERELRSYLGFSSDAPIHLGGAVFPTPQALPWYELILGRRIGENGHLTGSSTGVRRVELNDEIQTWKSHE
jgi:hypothetical protein